MSKSITIIGAGIAGLSAGVYARLNGFEADIYEQHTLPGGLCTAWKRKGFTFDGCIHWLTGSGEKDPFYPLWKELGAIDGATFHDHDIFYSFHGSDGRVLHFYTDVEQLEEHLLAFSPTDRLSVKEFCGWIRKFSGFSMPMTKAFEMFTPMDGIRMMGRMGKYMKDLNRMNSFTLKEYAQRFKDPVIREALSHIFGTDQYAVASVVMTMALLNNRAGGFPLGGSLEFARSIEKKFLDLGGRIHYGKRVDEILLEEVREVRKVRKVRGVRLEDGEEVRADYVISAADLRTTVYKMLGGKFVEPQHEALFETVKLAPSSVMLFFGLNRKFELSPATAASSFSTDVPIKIGNTLHHRFSVRDFNFDPSLSPEGKSVVSLLFVDDDFEYWEQLRNDRNTYRAKKERILGDVAVACEKVMPGFTAAIEATDVVTPKTYERYTSSYRGTYMTWMLSGKNAGKFRLVKKTLPGLENFYLSGMWVMPPGGVPTGAKTSRDVIQMICKKEKLKFI